jgi:hypothetical protein
VLSINISQDFPVTSKYADMWRTTLDMMPVWKYKKGMLRVGGDDVVSVIKQQEGLGKYQANGRWNDSEMLQVGNGKVIKTDNKDFDQLGEQTRLIKGNMTYDENKAHFGMWAINSAPLILSNDLSTMSDSLRDLVTNPEVIAINQDPAGMLSEKCKEDLPGVQVWVKRLWKIGDAAVAFLNATDEEQVVEIKLSDIGINGQAYFRDLFLRKDLGLFTGKFSVKLPKNSILLTKITAFEPVKPIKSLFKPLDFSKNSIRFEAEESRFYGGKSQDQLKGFSGSGYAIGENHVYSKFRFFWDLDIDTADNYKLVIKYINSGKEDLTYKINDLPIVFKSTASKKEKWNEISITLPFEKGRQKLKLIAPNSSSNELAIDYIELSKAVK